MSYCLKAGFSVSGSCNIITNHRGEGSSSSRVSSSFGALQFKESKSRDFWGKTLDLSDQKGVSNFSIKAPKLDPVHVSLLLSFYHYCPFKFEIFFLILCLVCFRHKHQFPVVKLRNGGKKPSNQTWWRLIQHKNWLIIY